MGTEILHPQDCLIERQHPFANPRSFRKQQQHPFGNPRSCRKPAKRSPQPDPHPKKSNHEDSRSGKNNLVIGPVTILKRGESLDSFKRTHEFKRNNLKKSVSLNEADLIVCGTDRLGPDPELVPKQIRLAEVLSLRSDVYAGSAFSQSPSPSSLPLPTFSRKNCMVSVDDSATKDLRRLLRLD